MRQRTEFADTVRRGARAAGPALTVHLRPAAPGSGRRVGFVVAKTVGPAVVRNGVRRRLRHLVRDRLGALVNDVAVVVRAHPAAAGLPSAALGQELDAALRRAHERAKATQ